MYKFHALVLLLFITAFTANSQSIDAAPTPRNQPAIAFDSKRGKLFLFGGFTGGFEDGIYLGDTWSFDGKAWRKVESGPAPAARGGKPGMTYDTVRKALVLFGGGSPQLAMNDLWLFNNGWSQKN